VAVALVPAPTPTDSASPCDVFPASFLLSTLRSIFYSPNGFFL
jgi:hypothetical protein